MGGRRRFMAMWKPLLVGTQTLVLSDWIELCQMAVNAH